LPVPVWLFIFGGAATVTMTFVMVRAFVRTDSSRYSEWRLELTRYPAVRFLFGPWVLGVVKWVAVALLLVVVAAGFFGTTDPNRSLAPTLVWVIWWVGLSYISMLIGDVWPLINPWRTIYDAVAARAARSPADVPRHSRYPSWLGAWPAVCMLLGFAWIEQIYPSGAQPSTMSTLILVYSVMTWIGMRVYGADVWLKNCDPFHNAFQLYGRFAPIQFEPPSPGGAKNPILELRPYAARLFLRG
jgi:small-conductance mechanosensitive channel